MSSPASITRKYVSPDGVLTLVVEKSPEDITLGFEGMPWHTRGDIRAAQYGLPQDEAVEPLIEELVQNRAVIAIASVHGVISDIWIADEPVQSDPYKPDNEVVAFRYRDGTPFFPRT